LEEINVQEEKTEYDEHEELTKDIVEEDNKEQKEIELKEIQ